MASVRSLEIQLAGAKDEVRDLRERLGKADEALAAAERERSRVAYQLQLAERQKISVQQELARTKARLDRAKKFVAAQTAYLADVLDPGKGA